MPLRPCMVSFHFAPSYSGSAIQAFNLSRHLRRLGACPMVVASNPGGSPAYEEMDGIPIHRIPAPGRGDVQLMSFALALARFLARRRREFDVIHVHGTLQHGLASIAGRVLHRPSVLKVAMLGSDIAFDHQGRTWGRVNRFLVSRFDRYIATTQAIADEFRAQRLDGRRVRLIPNGVDTEVHAPLEPEARQRLRSKLGLPDGPLVIYAGIINARKNVDGILRIWHEAIGLGAAGHLLLAGPVPDAPHALPFAENLRRWIAERRLESRVSFLGHRDPVAPYLQASDVFLFPSRQEGMPNSVLEAMACGLPCLVSSDVGVESVVSHGHNGWAIDVSNETEFARQLVEALRDPAARARMGACARRTIVTRFALDTIAARYLDLYGELLAQHS